MSLWAVVFWIVVALVMVAVFNMWPWLGWQPWEGWVEAGAFALGIFGALGYLVFLRLRRNT